MFMTTSDMEKGLRKRLCAYATKFYVKESIEGCEIQFLFIESSYVKQYQNDYNERKGVGNIPGFDVGAFGPGGDRTIPHAELCRRLNVELSKQQPLIKSVAAVHANSTSDAGWQIKLTITGDKSLSSEVDLNYRTIYGPAGKNTLTKSDQPLEYENSQPAQVAHNVHHLSQHSVNK